MRTRSGVIAPCCLAPLRFACAPFACRRHAYRVDTILEEADKWEAWPDANRELFWMGADTSGLPTLWLRGCYHHPGEALLTAAHLMQWARARYA